VRESDSRAGPRSELNGSNLEAMTQSAQELEEKPLTRETVYRGSIVTVHRDTVMLPMGREANRDVIEHSGAVAVVATDQDDRLLLVKQWRHPVQRALWEICAGGLEKNEDPLECAKRELAEETGFRASSWESLGPFALAAGYSTEIMSFFHASGLQAGETNPDEDENLQVELFDLGSVRALIADGEVDIKTIAGLALAGVNING
jgi:ADP-ribose pyrophosphatase